MDTNKACDDDDLYVPIPHNRGMLRIIDQKHDECKPYPTETFSYWLDLVSIYGDWYDTHNDMMKFKNKVRLVLNNKVWNTVLRYLYKNNIPDDLIRHIFLMALNLGDRLFSVNYWVNWHNMDVQAT